MRRRLAEGLVIVFSVASLGAGAASGPQGTEAAKVMAPVTPTAAQKTRTNKPKKNQPYQVGTASWYGDYFQGKPTASGEPYNMYDMTAAHMNLPLGTFVKVTNLRNGRSAVLRVNDRGPYVDGRVIDVSYNAAKALDFKARGLQRVRIDVVHPTVVASLN